MVSRHATSNVVVIVKAVMMFFVSLVNWCKHDVNTRPNDSARIHRQKPTFGSTAARGGLAGGFSQSELHESLAAKKDKRYFYRKMSVGSAGDRCPN